MNSSITITNIGSLWGPVKIIESVAEAVEKI